jgi:hypothetical protein
MKCWRCAEAASYDVSRQEVLMVAFRGHFDGKVLVPDEPLDLPRGQPLRIQVEAADRSAVSPSAAALLEVAGILSDEDAAEMRQAIEEEFEKVDPDE